MKRRMFLGAAAVASPAALLAASRRPDPEAPLVLAPSSSRTQFPNVLLTTHRGERVRFYDDVIRGNKIVVLNMMYTQCPEICGGTMVNLTRVQQTLGDRLGREVFMYSITLDPAHDRPAVLARYAELIGAGPDWTFLTGRRSDIERLRRALGWVDRDPELDRDRTQHTGMVRAGNDALDRWMACPGMGPYEQIAQEVLWVGMAQQSVA